MDKKTYTGYLRNTATVQKNSTIQIEYHNPKPNHFMVYNNGTVDIYCSTSGYPTTQKHDFKVIAGSSAVFAEPFERDRIYIYNASKSEDVNVTVTTLYAPFDAVTMALSNIKLGIDGEIKTDGTIKSFETSLPKGDNKIGSVDISNIDDIKSLLISGNGISYISSNNSIISTISKMLSGSQNSLLQSINNNLVAITATKEFAEVTKTKDVNCNISASNGKYIGEILHKEDITVTFMTEMATYCEMTIGQFNQLCHKLKFVELTVNNSDNYVTFLEYDL